MAKDYHIMDKGQARKSIKSLMYEATNLSPSSLIHLFEFDLTSVVKSIGSSLVNDGEDIGIAFGDSDDADNANILRFHNNVKAINSYIFWQGKTYFPAPIQAEGFDISSRGTLPTPVLRITAQKEEEIEALSILRRAVHKYGDIIGAKVTRIRTFAKYLDAKNFSDISQVDSTQGAYPSPFPDEYEPDPYAEFPRDVFYIERKSNENKVNLEYELSALIDVEGIKLPRRVVLSQKCSFAYRGCGCFYEQKESKKFNAITSAVSYSSSVASSGWSKTATSGAWEADQSHSAFAQTSTQRDGGLGTGTGALFSVETDSGGIPTFTWVSGGTGYAVSDTLTFTDPYGLTEVCVLYVNGLGQRDIIAGPGTMSPLLAKCGIRDSQLALPEKAPPVATIRDEDIKRILGVAELTPMGKWTNKEYKTGEYVKMTKNEINYYFVAKTNIPKSTPPGASKYAPPNPDYWISDMCSKTLYACRKRWGAKGAVEIGETKDFAKGELQYGGFPNATRLEQTLT
jgi:lambda family phage minor tail protein L